MFTEWETNEEGLGDNASVTELNSLSYLGALAISIPNASSLPNVQILKNLKTFHIRIGTKWWFDEKCTNLVLCRGIALRDEVGFLFEKAEHVYLRKVLKVNDDQCLFGKGRYSNLTYLEVIDCDKLRCLFPSSWVARQLIHLKKLNISNCEMMEEIVQNEREEDDEEVIIFHLLREIKLWKLPNMRTFYSNKKKPTDLGISSNPMDTLFNQKVSFLALKELQINGLNKIKGMWEEEILLLDKGKFSNLTSLRVVNCNSLRCLFPSRVARQLSHLKELQVIECEMMKEIVQNEREEDDKEVIIFHGLREIWLCNLPNMRTFRSNKKKPTTLGISPTTVETLFNQKVTFPLLERLYIDGLNNIEEMWSNNLPANSFNKLRRLDIIGCDKLSSIASSKLLSKLQSLQTVMVSHCGSLKVIFRSEGWKIGEKEIQTVQSDELATTKEEEFVLPPLLECVCMESLPCLQRFYSSNSYVEFSPSLRFWKDGCPKLDESQIIIKHREEN